MHNRCQQFRGRLPASNKHLKSRSKMGNATSLDKLTNIQFHNENFAAVSLQLNRKNKTATKVVRAAVKPKARKTNK